MDFRSYYGAAADVVTFLIKFSSAKVNRSTSGLVNSCPQRGTNLAWGSNPGFRVALLHLSLADQSLRRDAMHGIVGLLIFGCRPYVVFIQSRPFYMLPDAVCVHKR